MSVEDFRSKNVTSNNLELTETLNEEIRYLKNENITKTYIIKSSANWKASYKPCSSNNNTQSPSTGHCHPGRSNSENLAPRRNNSPK